MGVQKLPEAFNSPKVASLKNLLQKANEKLKIQEAPKPKTIRQTCLVPPPLSCTRVLILPLNCFFPQKRPLNSCLLK